MLKKLITLLFVLCNLFATSQTDSVITTSSINKNTEKTALLPPVLNDVFKPKIALGVGMLSFHGDLYAKHYQAPWTARIGYDLNISQRLAKPLQLNFNILIGKLGANEWIENRQENFEAEIRSGGLSLMYDFGNFISDDYRIRPWVSVGVNSFEFLSKTDLLDKNGNKYYYWSDGSIKNIDEAAPTASLAVNLNRDYYYESDVRELNKDGFGKYEERAWSFPIGFGALMKITDRFDFKIGAQYYFTTTDFVDGITNKSLNNRVGTKQKDNFVYSSFALQYDLVFKKKDGGDTLPDGYFEGIDWLAIDNGDRDKDGVKDWDDKCHGTPDSVKVDAFGCPFDDDKDGVANYKDDELDTPTGMEVNLQGVSLTDEYWQNWYDQYMDSGNIKKVETIENIYAKKNLNDSLKTNSTPNEKLYTVEIARYNGTVPSDEMAYLLSIGDVQSTVLPDNTTVLYTAGTYKEIENAVTRRDEFKNEGKKDAQVGYFKAGNLITLTNDEIAKLTADAKKAKDQTLSALTPTNAINTNTTTSNEQTNNATNTINENQFEKGEVVYRVQLGAYKNRISKGIFKNAGEVLELKSDDNLFRYATKGFKTIQNAANLKADLVVEGYNDAFITAYRNGKRIPLSETKATMDTKEKEDITTMQAFSSIDKSLISFKVQLGALRKAGGNDMEERTKDIKDVEKQATGLGMFRYSAGVFNNYNAADKYRTELNEKGFAEAFVIAIFKGEVISIQEALELMK